MTDTTNLHLPCIEGSQAQKHVTHNDALRMLDTLVQIAVADRDLAAPPASPLEGQRWIVKAGATGAWAGRDNAVAAWQDGGWQFSAPQIGWLAFVADEGIFVAWDGAAWTDWSSSVTVLQNLARLGVGTTADATNPLSAKLNNALFTALTTAEGGSGDLRYKMNKEAAANTLSLLFQTGFSGRAEIGLTGDDDLHFKVSSDGANFVDAAAIDHSTGEFITDGWRVGRDSVINVLPDSGRFNGNSSNNIFKGITYAAPSYLTAVSGASITSYGQFVYNNHDYGGTSGGLKPEIKTLIDKIRDPNNRRYGPEWYAVLVTQQTTGTLVEAEVIGGETYGLPFTNTFTALPKKYTAGFYMKVKSGKAAIKIPAAGDGRAQIDGVVYPGGSAPLVLTNADDWKYVNLQGAPYSSGYQYEAFHVVMTAGAQMYFALPRVVFGHVDLDPNLGVLMNGKMFG